MAILPRYPIYIPTKGRSEKCLTARFLTRDGVPFQLVIEPQEYDLYAAKFGEKAILVLPFSELGQGSIPARNWIWQHARDRGVERHWVMDDNLWRLRRLYKGYRIACAAGPALAAVEDFVDRYENVAIAGLNYTMFGLPKMPPFYLNVHVYSCMLLRTDLPFQWRGRYNEDTDLCLQVLAAGWCTILTNVFLAEKVGTMQMKGGNTDALYAADGRLKMARQLERQWPYVVSTDRRFSRPQHVVRDQWRKFDTPLKLKPGIDPAKLAEKNEYGLKLGAEKPVTSKDLRRLLDETHD
jgi:hypothetical protein